MKRTRQSFLATSAVAGAGLLALGATPAPTTLPSATPPPTPSPTATPAPSPRARAQALAMRRFDPALSDAEIDTIAGNIDQGYAAGSSLNPHGKKLLNGNAPDPEFNV